MHGIAYTVPCDNTLAHPSGSGWLFQYTYIRLENLSFTCIYIRVYTVYFLYTCMHKYEWKYPLHGFIHMYKMSSCMLIQGRSSQAKCPDFTFPISNLPMQFPELQFDVILSNASLNDSQWFFLISLATGHWSANRIQIVCSRSHGCFYFALIIRCPVLLMKGLRGQEATLPKKQEEVFAFSLDFMSAYLEWPNDILRLCFVPDTMYKRSYIGASVTGRVTRTSCDRSANPMYCIYCRHELLLY